MTPKDYNLWINYSHIEQISAQLNLSEAIIVGAKLIYKETHIHKIKRGNVKKGYIGACIFVSCKIHHCNCVSHSKLAEIIGIDRKFITQNIKFIEKNIWNFESYKSTIVEHKNNYQDYLFFIVGVIENPTPQYLPQNIIDNWNEHEPLFKIQPFSKTNNGFFNEIKKLTKFIENSIQHLISSNIHIQPDILTASLIYIYIIDTLTTNHYSNYKQYLKKILAYAIKSSMACLHNKISLCRDSGIKIS